MMHDSCTHDRFHTHWLMDAGMYKDIALQVMRLNSNIFCATASRPDQVRQAQPAEERWRPPGALGIALRLWLRLNAKVQSAYARASQQAGFGVSSVAEVTLVREEMSEHSAWQRLRRIASCKSYVDCRQICAINRQRPLLPEYCYVMYEYTDKRMARVIRASSARPSNQCMHKYVSYSTVTSMHMHP